MRTIAILTALAVAACVQTISMPDASEGAGIYGVNCAQCHGVSGKGDGPWAAGLSPRPADLTELSNGGEFRRGHVLSVIDGYDRTGLPGQDMPEFGLLLEGDTVPVDVGDGVLTPTPRPLAALMTYLESIQAN